MKYRVILEASQDGGYAVHVPALPGCHTQGETVEEALQNAKDAVRVYLRTLRQSASKRNKRGLKVYEIAVAA